MTPNEQIQAIQAITVMFNSFPQQPGISADLQLSSYLDCVTDQSGAAVEAACRRYRMGDVPGHDPRFLPSSAQFTAEVRKQQKMVDASKVRKIAPPLDHVPESPPVAKWKLQVWRDRLAGRISWDEFQQAVGIKTGTSQGGV